MSMSIESARRVERPAIVINKEYEFYSEMQQEYEPREDRLRNYTGCTVKVLRQLGPDEVDKEVGSMFEVVTLDGFKFTAHTEELNGWDRDLGQFFWPDGTYGPDHDRTFLVNEKDG